MYFTCFHNGKLWQKRGPEFGIPKLDVLESKIYMKRYQILVFIMPDGIECEGNLKFKCNTFFLQRICEIVHEMLRHFQFLWIKDVMNCMQIRVKLFWSSFVQFRIFSTILESLTTYETISNFHKSLRNWLMTIFKKGNSIWWWYEG